MWFKLHQTTPQFLYTAPWIFRSKVVLQKVSAETCWSILMDDNAWQYWHPQVQNIQWKSDLRTAGSERTVLFSDPLFNMLLFGPTELDEDFPVWEEGKSFQLSVKATTRPATLTYQSIREEFVVSSGPDDGSSIFTRTVAINPSFVSRYLLGWLVYPRLKQLFTVDCPRDFELYSRTVNKKRQD